MSSAPRLVDEDRVRPRGLREIEAARADGRWEAAYPPASRIQVPDDLWQALEAAPDAAAFFATLTGANRYAIPLPPPRRARAQAAPGGDRALGRPAFPRETPHPAAGAEPNRASPVVEAESQRRPDDGRPQEEG